MLQHVEQSTDRTGERVEMSGTAVHGGLPGGLGWVGWAGLGWARGTDGRAAALLYWATPQGRCPFAACWWRSEFLLAPAMGRPVSPPRGCPLLAFVKSRCCQAAGTVLGVGGANDALAGSAVGDKIGQIRSAVSYSSPH